MPQFPLLQGNCPRFSLSQSGGCTPTLSGHYRKSCPDFSATRRQVRDRAHMDPFTRDDRPFAGPAPPAAIYYASSDRRGEHPQKHLAGFGGILQCDCYSVFEPSTSNWPTSRKRPRDGKKGNRSPRSRWRQSGASTRCSRSGAPSTAAARTSGMPCGRRSKPLLDDMYAWLLRERDTLSRSSEALKPMLGSDFARCIDHGRICLSNNAAESALRGIALGRRNWTFAGPSAAQSCRRHAHSHHDLPSQRPRKQLPEQHFRTLQPFIGKDQ